MPRRSPIQIITDTKAAAPLFQNWDETLIWSCLQGVMGAVYADDPIRPESAAAVLGDFAFLAGIPQPELLAPLKDRDYMILVPQNEAWQQAVTTFFGDAARIVSRFATKKEPEVFCREDLEHIVSALPHGYRLHLIDSALFQMCRSCAWSADLVSQFPTYEHYRKLGLGVVALNGDGIAAGASSYSSYRGGIEIEIDTKKEHRRKGLASVCGAALILECLKRGLYPSWDAHNQASLALAEKLGYHYSHTYTAIEVGTFPDALPNFVTSPSVSNQSL